MSIAAEQNLTKPRLQGLLAVVAAVILSAPFLALASWGDETEGNPLRRFFVTVAFATAAALLTFMWAVPRAGSSRRPVVILAVLAALSIPAYWVGVTAVFGLGATLAARRQPSRNSLAKIAAVVGILATIAFVAITSFAY